MGNRGHCILAISHLLPARSHGGASSRPSTMPAFLTNITHATGTSVVVGTTETHAEAPCQPLRLTHAIPQAHPCKTRGYPGLPEPAQYCCTFFRHQQKTAAHSQYGHLANLRPSKHLHSKHSPLHYSSILCQPSPAMQPPGFGPPLGRWCFNKSKPVTSGVMFADVQIQSSHLAMCQVVEHKALLLRAAGCIWWEGQGVPARRQEATVRAKKRTVSTPHRRGGLNYCDQRQTWLLRKA